MEGWNPFGGGGNKRSTSDGSGFNWNALGNFSQLSGRTQQHLRRVYENLTITAALAAIACFLFVRGSLPLPGIMALIMLLLCSLGALLIPDTPGNSMVRHGALYGFGFTQGWVTAPLVSSMLDVDPGAVAMATIGAVIIFASFTMSAFNSPRREYLYLGGMLASITGMMGLAFLANLFVSIPGLHSAQLYIGLFVFSLYVLYDTQVIVERAEAGSTDAVRHAMTLFTDFAEVVIRLLVIFSRNTQQKKDKKRRPQ